MAAPRAATTNGQAPLVGKRASAQSELEVLRARCRRQASVIAYGRIYVLSAIIILVLIPLLLLVRKTKGAGGAHAIME